MKSILTLVMFFALLSGINANHNKATVVIKSADNLPIIVELNNRHNEYARTVHKFEHIRAGSHYVKIFKPRSRYQNHHGARLLFNGRIRAFQGYKTVYKLDCGRLILVKKHPYQQHYAPTSCNCPNHGHCNSSSCGCNSCGGSNGWNGGHQGYNNTGCQTGYSNNNWNHGNGYQNTNNNNGYYNDNDNHYYGPRSNPNSHYDKKSMRPSEFSQLMQNIRNISSDSGKVAFVKKRLVNEQMSSNQVRVILGQLFFEGNKVEVAKFLYPKTSDQDQFSQVMDEFYFNSSKKEINKLITYKK